MKRILVGIIFLIALIAPVLADTVITGEFTNITITADVCPVCVTIGDQIQCNMCPLGGTGATALSSGTKYTPPMSDDMYKGGFIGFAGLVPLVFFLGKR